MIYIHFITATGLRPPLCVEPNNAPSWDKISNIPLPVVSYCSSKQYRFRGMVLSKPSLVFSHGKPHTPQAEMRLVKGQQVNTELMLLKDTVFLVLSCVLSIPGRAAATRRNSCRGGEKGSQARQSTQPLLLLIWMGRGTFHWSASPLWHCS